MYHLRVLIVSHDILTQNGKDEQYISVSSPFKAFMKCSKMMSAMNGTQKTLKKEMRVKCLLLLWRALWKWYGISMLNGKSLLITSIEDKHVSSICLRSSTSDLNKTQPLHDCLSHIYLTTTALWLPHISVNWCRETDVLLKCGGRRYAEPYNINEYNIARLINNPDSLASREAYYPRVRTDFFLLWCIKTLEGESYRYKS